MTKQLEPRHLETPQDDKYVAADADLRRGNEHLAAGVGLGALSIGGVVLLGVSCPLCVVAAPALIGSGLWRRRRARRNAAQGQEEPFALDWSAVEPDTPPERR